MPVTPSLAAAPSVKLVVWDLDDSLWDGTLSEGAVSLLPGRADLLAALVDRGVMVSISSRNDPRAARAELERLGLWDLFVFPRIGWQAKGPQVRDLIHAAHLRPENVLFVDDNHLNREEVRAAAPGIAVLDPATPEFGTGMAAIVASARQDRGRRRLAEYRMLEVRATASAAFDDNVAFLRTSAIRVEVAPATLHDAERVHELIARTNQLNYTKQRIDLEAVRRLLADTTARSTVIRVHDRFGDHGLVGVAVVRDAVAEHFAFSCRILGMGVERAVHRYLGSPAVDVAEPVSAPLEGPDPDWLTIVAVQERVATPAVPTARTARTAPGSDVLFVGGCDLQSSIAFLRDRDAIATHFNYSRADNPRLVVHRDSIDFLLADSLTAAERSHVLETVPFVDAAALTPPEWGRYRHIVYSPLIDYVQAKYASAGAPGFHLSYGDVEAPVIDDARFAVLTGRYGVDPDALRRFVETWAPVVKRDELWESQLDELLTRMSGAATVTVVLGATATFDGLDEHRVPTHRRANDLVRRAAGGRANVRLVEVDPFLHGRDDFADGIRHYSRRVYRDLADELAAAVGLTRAAAAPRGERHGDLVQTGSARRLVSGAARGARCALRGARVRIGG